VLNGCDAVFHLAGRSLQLLFGEGDEEEAVNKEYLRDNLTATEVLIDQMIDLGIPLLVFVGDALANLPMGDNFGLSEEMHLGLPSSFLLGQYGESKTRAELYARNALKRDPRLRAIFLRPTFIFGEGEHWLIDAAIQLCQAYGHLPYADGDNRGLHQFIYAGNMAAILEKSLVLLQQDADRINGEICYCMDSTKCTRVYDFLQPYLKSISFDRGQPINYFFMITGVWWNQFRRRWFNVNWPIPSLISARLLINWPIPSLISARLLIGWTVGFSGRKLRLLLDFVSPIDQAEAMRKSVNLFVESGRRTCSR